MANATHGQNDEIKWQALPPGPYRSNGPNANTLNAVSFGFIATAVLFAMFLVMAIFERILRPHRNRADAGDAERAESIPGSSSDSVKDDGRPLNYSSAVPVIMAGEDFPTYFAVPAPVPCKTESVVYPSHDVSSLSLSEASDKEIFHDVELGHGKASASSPSEKEVFQELIIVVERGECSSHASPGKEDIEVGQEEESSGSSPDRNSSPSPGIFPNGTRYAPGESILPSSASPEKEVIQDLGRAQVEASISRILTNGTPFQSPRTSPDESFLPSPASPEKDDIQDVGRAEGESSSSGPGGKELLEDKQS